MNLDIRCGSCVHMDLPDASVDCVITSPPYWGLRDYSVDGQIGLEGSPEEYVERLVEVFREVRRVLKDSGTVWLNLGDSYAATTRSAGASMKSTLATRPTAAKTAAQREHGSWRTSLAGLKPKDLVGIPWRVAFALQADGWWLRQDIIWAKPNPMPESVRDRCTKSHEYVFLLTKSKSYYFDAEAIREPVKPSCDGTIRAIARTANGPLGGANQHNIEERRYSEIKGANKRDVWWVATKPYSEVHFAVFPEKLIEPMILAGCPPGGTVLDPFCGSGTTLLVALKLGRNAVGYDLSEKYCEMARQRCNETQVEMIGGRY